MPCAGWSSRDEEAATRKYNVRASRSMQANACAPSATREKRPPVLAAVNHYMNGRNERIRTSDPSVPNQGFGKNVSVCLFKSCSHQRKIMVFRFVPIPYHSIYVACCYFCPRIGQLQPDRQADSFEMSNSISTRHHKNCLHLPLPCLSRRVITGAGNMWDQVVDIR